ncbi:MAG: type II secretion system F family protein [Clostridia bacterium]
MPKYSYIAKDSEGKTIKSIANANNESELFDSLRKADVFLISAKEKKLKLTNRKLKSKQVSDFCRQLGTLLSAGVSLVRTIGIMTRDENCETRIRGIYVEILRLISQGISFSEALEQQGNVFPELLINMFKAAESNGTMDVTARKMAVHYEKEDRLNGKIKSALLYPKILAVMTILICVGLFTFVLPNFVSLFEGMELPGLTKFVMSIGDFVATKWYILLFIVAALSIFISIIKRIPNVKWFIDKMILRIPKVGKLLKVIYTARFARTLSSQYASGLPIVVALQVGKNTIGNKYIASQFDDVITRIRRGETLSHSLSFVDGFEKKLIANVLVGEETGNLEYMLGVVAESYEFESEMAIQALLALMEPVMLVIMAAIVLLVMLSVLLPIFNSYEALSKS